MAGYCRLVIRCAFHHYSLKALMSRWLQGKAREGHRCGRTVDIQKVDPVRLTVPASLRNEVGQRRLDAGGRTLARSPGVRRIQDHAAPQVCPAGAVDARPPSKPSGTGPAASTRGVNRACVSTADQT